MKKAPVVSRILLGLIFVVFGLNKFLNFMPPPALPPEAGKFFGALMETGYLLPVLAAFEMVLGLLLLSGRFIGLASLMLVPITLNVMLFHLFLDGSTQGIIMGVAIFALNVLLLISNKEKYQYILKP